MSTLAVPGLASAEEGGPAPAPSRGRDRAVEDGRPARWNDTAGAFATTDLDHGVTPTQLAQSLVGGTSVSVSNVTYTGASRSAGTFTNGTDVAGIDSGVILTSGYAQTVGGDEPDATCARGVEGPNQCEGNSVALGGVGDAELTALARAYADSTSLETFDATVLEFDFVPSHNAVSFNYVFGSEEYREFANTGYNDVFAFFINGQNCAEIPGTDDPVAVNTINNGNPTGDPTPHNEELYRDNPPTAPTIDTELDGLTVVLPCNSSVNPGVTNHAKLAIADAGDDILDSAVLIQAGSFVSMPLTLGLTQVGQTGNVNEGTLGRAVTPDAALSGSDAGTATGTVSYSVYEGPVCSGAPFASAGTVTVTGGNVPAGTPVVPVRPQSYSWRASYSGDGSHAATTSPCEPFRAWPAVARDFDADDDSDIGVFRPSTGTWHIQGQPSTIAYGTNGDIPVPGDYDRDGNADVAVFRPSSGTWHVQGNGPVAFGTATDIPLPGDYDGDGDTDFAFYRPSTHEWHIHGQGTDPTGEPGDIPVPADYSGDGRTDIAVFRPSDATWYLANGAVFWAGERGDIPVPADFDGDHRVEPATFRPSTGTWHFSDSASISHGTVGDVPIPSDFDGDGDADLTVFRPATRTWHVRNVSNVPFGAAGDIPLVPPVKGPPARTEGDYDGDGRADISLFRPSNGTWYRPGAANRAFGTNGDIPTPGDWNGDGALEIGLFRPSTRTWHRPGLTTVTFGATTDIPVVGDWDGNGTTDIGVFRPSTGTWHRPGLTTVTFGANGDIPVVGDWDGNGTTDIGLFRPSAGTWHRPGLATVSFGTNGDLPTVADWDGNGTSDIALFRPSNGTWYRPGAPNVQFGANGDVPAFGDWNGDGVTDRGLFRPSTGNWHRAGQVTTAFGTAGDIPTIRPNRKPTAL